MQPAGTPLRQCRPETAACAGHSLAEFYATLTRLPPPHRASVAQVLLFLENMEQHLAVVSLTSSEYQDALRSAAATGITGGVLYDFLIARCALKANAAIIYTWNTKHYQLFGTEIVARLRLPEAIGTRDKRANRRPLSPNRHHLTKP